MHGDAPWSEETSAETDRYAVDDVRRGGNDVPAWPRKEPRMLVLSRQRDETIMIGDDVEITVVDIRGDKVRLGITAPAHIPVHRKEVYEAIQRENRAASQIRPEDLGNTTPPSEPSKGERPPRPPRP
jgi:carbon storage regulator